jgi:hypothetical protein
MMMSMMMSIMMTMMVENEALDGSQRLKKCQQYVHTCAIVLP